MSQDRFREAARERLHSLSLFQDLPPGELDRLAALSRVLHLEKKATLFVEGEPYRGMFVVLSGLVVVYRTSDEGRMLILHVCRAGDSIAEVGLFETEDAGFPAHARATRESEILFLPRESFVPFLREHSQVAWCMLSGFAARLKEMTLRLEGVTLREVTERLARYLLREMEAGGVARDERPRLTLPLTKGSVASYLGTVHETLSRSFARLIRDKVIAVDGPEITILDKKKLQRLS